MLMLGKMSVGVRKIDDRRGDEDQQREHDEGIGAVERDFDDPHV